MKEGNSLALAGDTRCGKSSSSEIASWLIGEELKLISQTKVMKIKQSQGKIQLTQKWTDAGRVLSPFNGSESIICQAQWA